MTQQRGLFDPPLVSPSQQSPREQASGEPARLAGQCAKIIARLRKGPATNRELCEIGLNYRARISELRQAGWNIPAPVEREDGLTFYRLIL